MRPNELAEFEAFAASRWPALVRLGYVLGVDHQEAEDLAQAALTKCYQRWASIKDKQAAHAFARTCLTRAFISSRRRRTVRHEWVESPADFERSHVAAEEPRTLDSTWQAVLELPARQRAAVVLRFYEDLSVADTAEVMNCSPGSVKTHTSRALTRLGSVLAAEDARRP